MVVVGPLLDGFITQMGREFLKRLRHGRTTGIVESQPFYFPYSIFIQFVKMVKGYGGDFKFFHGKSFLITIDKEYTTRKVFHPRRLDGINYLVKRSFKKAVSSRKLEYCGQSRIVVMRSTPITITYKVKLQSCKLTYYVQRYNHLDEAVNTRLQTILNGNSEWTLNKNGYLYSHTSYTKHSRHFCFPLSYWKKRLSKICLILGFKFSPTFS